MKLNYHGTLISDKSYEIIAEKTADTCVCLFCEKRCFTFKRDLVKKFSPFQKLISESLLICWIVFRDLSNSLYCQRHIEMCCTNLPEVREDILIPEKHNVYVLVITVV